MKLPQLRDVARWAGRWKGAGFRPDWRWSLLGFVVFFVLGAAVFSRSNGAAHQPIAFNHSKHVSSGMACTDCHAGAREQEHATLPTLSVCITCHESAVTQSPEEEKIRVAAAARKELAWSRVTRVPTHVYFSHRRHVQIGGMECSVCHGAMEKLTAPPAHPFRQFTMDACINCHQQKQARTDCNDCHR